MGRRPDFNAAVVERQTHYVQTVATKVMRVQVLPAAPFQVYRVARFQVFVAVA